MIKLPEFIEQISNKDKAEISLEDCRNYYKLLSDLNDDERLKVFGRENLNKMALAYRIYWESALNQFCDLFKSPVELPIPRYICYSEKKDMDLRRRWKKMVPLDTSVEDCKAILHKMFSTRSRLI